MDRQEIRTELDGRSQVFDVSYFAHDVRGLVVFCFYPLEEKIVNKSCFQSILQVQTVFAPISRPDKHAELLKNYFKPLDKKLKFSLLVANSDLRFKVQ